jgi:hypothetical protein
VGSRSGSGVRANVSGQTPYKRCRKRGVVCMFDTTRVCKTCTLCAEAHVSCRDNDIP